MCHISILLSGIFRLRKLFTAVFFGYAKIRLCLIHCAACYALLILIFEAAPVFSSKCTLIDGSLYYTAVLALRKTQ
jgi:hypothetical protein